MSCFAHWFRFGVVLTALAGFGALTGVAAEEPKEGEHGKSHGDAEHGDAEHGDDSGHGDSHGGHHHDDSDLSHANAGDQLEDPSELRSDLAIYTFVVFLILLVLLMKLAWGPIMDGLEKREGAIASNIEEAKQSAEKAQQVLEEHQAKLAAVADETRAMIAEAKKDAESTKDRILAEAKETAERERQRAIEDIRLAKDAAVQELAQKSVDTAVSLAGRMLSKEVDSTAHADLIKDALEQFPSQN